MIGCIMKPRAERRSATRGNVAPRFDAIPALSNAVLAELLALEAEKQSHFVAKAFRRASRLAFTWPEEAATLLEQGRSITELPAIGPYLAKVIQGWIEEAPHPPEPPAIRRNFITMTEAKRIVDSKRGWASGYKG